MRETVNQKPMAREMLTDLTRVMLSSMARATQMVKVRVSLRMKGSVMVSQTLMD